MTHEPMSDEQRRLRELFDNDAEADKEMAAFAQLMSLTRQAYETPVAETLPDLRSAVRESALKRNDPVSIGRWLRWALVPALGSALAIFFLLMSAGTNDPESLFDSGMALYDEAFASPETARDTKLRQSIRVFEKLQKKYPEETELASTAAVFVADSYRALGQNDKAAETYQAVLTDYPGSEDACAESRLALANLYLENGAIGNDNSMTDEERVAFIEKELTALMSMTNRPAGTGELCIRFADLQYEEDPWAAEPWYQKGIAMSPAISRETARARKTLAGLEEKIVERSYVKDWWFAGPFRVNYLSTPRPPEQGFDPAAVYEGADGQKVRWFRPYTQKDYGYVNFNDVFKKNDKLTGYAYTEVYSPDKRLAQLRVSSDDSVRVWLNGESVLANPATRGLNQSEDRTDVTLHKGWNTVLVKVQDRMPDGWALSFRITSPDGNVMRDLVFDPEGTRKQ